jgi:hypothetical protein
MVREEACHDRTCESEEQAIMSSRSGLVAMIAAVALASFDLCVGAATGRYPRGQSVANPFRRE